MDAVTSGSARGSPLNTGRDSPQRRKGLWKPSGNKAPRSGSAAHSSMALTVSRTNPRPFIGRAVAAGLPFGETVRPERKAAKARRKSRLTPAAQGKAFQSPAACRRRGSASGPTLSGARCRINGAGVGAALQVREEASGHVVVREAAFAVSRRTEVIQTLLDLAGAGDG